MSAPNEKLAVALRELQQLQKDGARVFATSELTRTVRERLLKHGFLQEVMRGWVMAASPDTKPGDTTPWFASFWEFCRRYCTTHFGDDWNLSPEQSLLLHAEHTAIPKQLLVHSPHAGNNSVALPFGTSLFVLKTPTIPADVEVRDGLRIYSVAAALARVTADFFERFPVETQIVVSRVRDPSALLAVLLDGGHSAIAGRLAGLFRRLDHDAVADEIVAAMTAADHKVVEVDPLAAEAIVAPLVTSKSPLVARLQMLWATSRGHVLAEFPPASKPPRSRAPLKHLDAAYDLDAYHSLSIEGYQVTPELVERVATGRWDPDRHSADRDNQNALAARGYWLAFQRVRENVGQLLGNDGKLATLRTAHREWYRALFEPHVTAGLLPASTLAGYRRAPVLIRGSRHVPPRYELLGDAMPALFELVEREPSSAVRAVLGHWLLGYLHPFPDGNGRIARFLMNALFVAGGYPWTVIRVEHRARYLDTLETASTTNDIRPFAKFIASELRARTKP